MNLLTKIGRQIETLLKHSGSVYGQLVSASSENGCDIILVNFTPTSLCQYRVHDIRNSELLIFRLEEGVRPAVFPLREDFPLTSHQNIDGDRRELCLFDLTYEELKSLLDGSFLLKQVDDWLCRVASDELHGVSQPLEPYFFTTDSMIVLTEPSLPRFHLQPVAISGLRFFVQHTLPRNADCFPVIHVHYKIDVETDNIIKSLPRNLHELIDAFPSNKIEDEIAKMLITAEREMTDRNTLEKAHILLSLLISKTMPGSDRESVIEVRCALTKQKGASLRRLLGLDMNNLGAKDLTAIEIELHSYCYDIDKVHAALYNGILEHGALNTKILQIGVGALGSQILNNCVRAGFGVWTLVDKDIFLPHNVARHKLDPGDFGSYKADIMGAWLDEFYKEQESPKRQLSYPIDVLKPEKHDDVCRLIQTSDVILDTAASRAVSKVIAIDHHHSRRIIAFFMNPSGSSAIALIENKERTCRIDTIEYEYFKRLVDHPLHSSHFERTEKVYYSTSCRSSSSTIPQDAVAAYSALCSKKLKNALISECAEVLIWTEEDDGITLDKFKPSQYQKHELTDSSGDIWTVLISNEVENEIKKARLATSGVETGGILVGDIDKSRNIIYIVKNIPAPIDSIHAPTSYIRGCKGLPGKLKNIADLSHNVLGYVGEWHSHPSSDTSKSSDDDVLYEAMKDFASNNCSPATLIIVGSCDYSIYI